MRVELPAALQDAIFAAARTAYPRECCGLLEGVWDGEVAVVQALHAARNLSRDCGTFQIDPADHIAAQKSARAAGRALIGCYHSHPDGQAEPSAADLAGAGAQTLIWLIAAGDTLAAFVYLRGGFTGAECVTSVS